MHGYVGLTDFDWYMRLSTLRATEANFWTPGARPPRMLSPGEPLFFLLKKPMAAICGFGIFARRDLLPVWLAWDTFGQGNGVDSLAELTKRIKKYRRGEGTFGELENAQIGCLVLEECVFFPEEHWVRRPSDWHDNIVSGKGYDLMQGEGLRLWRDVIGRGAIGAKALPLVETARDAARYGAPMLVQPRLGQGAFRLEVTDAYGKACAVTTEHSLPVLEAAHIKPYAVGGPHDVRNGMLLRTDIHRLFDRGYVTVAEDGTFAVSTKLKEDYENGKAYYAMNGQKVNVPAVAAKAPAPEFLRWHQENVFRA